MTCHTVNDSNAFKGISTGESNSNSRQQSTHIRQKWIETTHLGAGNHTFEYGWRTRNSQSGNRPAYQINPNSSDDNRMHQMSSTFTFYEILI